MPLYESFKTPREQNQLGCVPIGISNFPETYMTNCQYFQNMNYDMTRDAFDWSDYQVFPLFLTPQLYNYRSSIRYETRI